MEDEKECQTLRDVQRACYGLFRKKESVELAERHVERMPAERIQKKVIGI